MIGKTFDRIDAIYPIATKTERKLIDGMRKIKRSDLIYFSITELASQVKVAEATIVRMCHKLGYDGFQDFKLCLSRELGNIDNLNDGIARQIANRMTDAINETYKSLDYDKCVEIADLTINANKVCAFGVGNSYITTVEISNVLARIGINVTATADSHLQAMIAANMKENDLIFLISVSGSTKDIIDVAKIVKSKKVKIVVITCYDQSPLAKYGDYILYSTRREAAYEGGSMSTVVSISYIVDVLYNAIYEKLGNEAYERTLSAAGAVASKSI